MKKKYFVLLMAIVVFVAFFIYAGSDMVTIKKTGTKKGSVTFNHANHSKLDKCESCHHHKDDTADKKQSCSKCHSDAKGMKAMHQNCVKRCHKKDKKGPFKCNDCHKKKEN